MQIRVQHRGYADPNGLQFDTIQVLGQSTAVQQLVVRENGAQLPSQHILMYNSTTQVGRAPGRGGWEWGTVGWENVNLGGRGWKVE